MKFFSLIAWLMLFLAACGNASDVRPPAAAGQFYPKDPEGLSRTVDSYLCTVRLPKFTGDPVAVLVPHAGYMYSGPTAAFAYAALSGREINTIILIGNSHRFPLSRGAVYTHGSFSTPLGPVPVNTLIAERLIKATPLVADDAAPHLPEHSLEVQLPFLQRTHPGVSIVPILLGQQTIGQCRALGKTIAQVIRGSGETGTTVLVASSDMSHYPDAVTAEKADGEALAALARMDPDALQKTVKGILTRGLRNEECVFCGEESLYTVMYAARELGADKAVVLHYTNSGKITGGTSRAVGYGAAVFTTSKTKNSREDSMPEKPFSITDKSQKILLSIARQAIAHRFGRKKSPDIDAHDPELQMPAAVFVTLTKGGQLRGCIGTTEPHWPLAEAVSRMAVSAAFDDYRFPPVTENELNDIRIEISVLSPLTRVKNADEIQQNVHGVIVSRNGRSGLFLPQVWEHFSKKEDFLYELSRQKAGLEPDAWRDPETELYVFTVFAFEEH